MMVVFIVIVAVIGNAIHMIYQFAGSSECLIGIAYS